MDYTKYVKDLDGNEVLWCAAVNLMDDEIREELHMELVPCDEQTFFTEYLIRHKAKFNENFTV